MNILFESFGHTKSGRLVTHHGDYEIVAARNPYGFHNLVLLWRGSAIRHGNVATLEWAATFPTKQYRKVRKHLAVRGIGVEWVVTRF